jgi:hypothetical protein
VARIKVNLLDEDERLIDSVVVDDDGRYTLNGYFRSLDRGLYLICEVKDAEPPIATELTGIWIDGTHPTSRIRTKP